MKTRITLALLATIFSLTLLHSVNSSAQSTTTMYAQKKISVVVTDSLKIKKQIFGFAFLAPLNDHIELNYERTVKNQISFSGALGIIGAGIDNAGLSPRGLYLKAGPKLYFTPDYLMDGMYRMNDFQGGYFKPEIIIDYYSALTKPETSGNYTTDRSSTVAMAFMLTFGKQYVVANAVSLDWNVGLGYGTSSGNNNGNHYSHAGGNSDTPFCFSLGLTLGFLTK